MVYTISIDSVVLAYARFVMLIYIIIYAFFCESETELKRLYGDKK